MQVRGSLKVPPLNLNKALIEPLSVKEKIIEYAIIRKSLQLDSARSTAANYTRAEETSKQFTAAPGTGSMRSIKNKGFISARGSTIGRASALSITLSPKFVGSSTARQSVAESDVSSSEDATAVSYQSKRAFRFDPQKNITRREKERIITQRLMKSTRARDIQETELKKKFHSSKIREAHLSDEERQIAMQATMLHKGDHPDVDGYEVVDVLDRFKRRKGLTYFSSLSDQTKHLNSRLLMLLKLMDGRVKLNNLYRSRVDMEGALEILLYLIAFTVELDDYKLFTEVLLLIAETHLMMGADKTAIQVLNTLREVCNMTRYWQPKIELLRDLHTCARKVARQDWALRFLKRALQYVWLINDTDSEVYIYEEMGLCYFYLGELARAYHFHRCSTEMILYRKDSIDRKVSEKNLEQFYRETDLYWRQIDKLFLSVATFLPFRLEPMSDFEEFAPHISNTFMRQNRLKLYRIDKKFSLPYDSIYQLNLILQFNEFSNEISTPRKIMFIHSFGYTVFFLSYVYKIMLTKYISTPPGFSKEEEEEMEQLHHQILAKKVRFIVPERLRKQQSSQTFHLDDEYKKVPLSKAISLRVNSYLKLEAKRAKMGFSLYQRNTGSSSNNLNDRLELSHLTPNRSIYNYPSSLSISMARQNLLFDRMIYQKFQETKIIQMYKLI